MKIHTLPSGLATPSHGGNVEVNLDTGGKAIFSRDGWQKLTAKGWRMEDAYVHVPWRNVPERLPLTCRLWLYFWLQRSLQANEDITIRHAMLRQWGFAETTETIRKALHRMQSTGLLRVISNGKKQLRVVLTEPRPPSKRRTNLAEGAAVLDDLNTAVEGDVGL